ncbi:MAG: PRD domain-containing protein [Streptococcus sp.]|nr:PRD domain-containing protein [Streptococcus sp.]
MKIDKVYNNNVVQVVDDSMNELILMGKGLGFQKKTGDEIDISKVEKKFKLEEDTSVDSLSQVYSNFSSNEMTFVLNVIKKSEETLGQKFDTALYVALADHFHFLIERSKKGIFIKNPLFWEVRKFYKLEYELGIAAIEELSQLIQIHIDNDEATSIALHLVNAQKDGSIKKKSIKTSRIISDITDIVRLEMGDLGDTDSISYNRFITHIQYFAQRVVSHSEQGNNDAFLYEQVKSNYPKPFACVQKIEQYIKTTYNFPMSIDEQVYLTIHIQRLQKNKCKW